MWKEIENSIKGKNDDLYNFPYSDIKIETFNDDKLPLEKSNNNLKLFIMMVNIIVNYKYFNKFMNELLIYFLH